MSSPSDSPRLLDHEKNHESDTVQDSHPQISVNPEIPPQNQPDPTKSNPETLPVDNPAHPEKEDEEEEADDAEGKEQEIPEENTVILAGMPQPITGSNASTHDVTLPVSSHNRNPNFMRGASKRKKGKGKGKPNIKKQQMYEKKLQSLIENLNPIPFIPHKILDFSKHEDLFRKVGLWDFVNIDFDRNLRKDLIAQLVASYESRCSYVNGHRIGVNRADMARAFKIPLKKDKGNAGGMQMDLDFEPFSDNSLGFMVEFVSDWVLLHDDMWMMPDEVMNWIKLVKDGHPEKVDWAGLIWFMVEKELAQGENLRNCYYASHLQHLMKEQRIFLKEEAEGKLVEINEEAKEEDVKEGNGKVDDAIMCRDEENGVGPSVELTLGPDVEKEEDIKEEEIMDLDNLKEENDEEGVNEQEQWLMRGKNDVGDNFLQRCGSENGGELGESSKLEGEETEFEENGEAGDTFNVFGNDALVGEGLTGNFLQSMEANQINFSSGQPNMQQMGSGPSFLNDLGKRAIEHDDNVMFSHSLTDSNKRLKINGPIMGQKPLDFGTCLENAQQMMEQARMFYQEKENALEQININNQILLNEVHKRDNVIELLHKSRFEEMQKKDNEIYRYERELFLMGNVLEGYRKALKDTKKSFDEYRKRAQLLEEPAYKDVGGGLMLSTGEIERIRKKNEEEFQIKCLIVEQRVKEAENDCVEKFDVFLEKINILDKKLTGLEANAKELNGSFAKRKVFQNDEKVLADEEKVAEVVAELNPADEADNCQ